MRIFSDFTSVSLFIRMIYDTFNKSDILYSKPNPNNCKPHYPTSVYHSK